MEHLQNLKRYLHRVPIAFKTIPVAELAAKAQPDKWSKKEILGHLIDSARINWQRFIDMAYGTETPYQIMPYPQNELVQQNSYQQQPTAHLIQSWQGLNQQIANLLATLSEAQLARLVVAGYANQSGDLRWWIQDYVEHLEHHLKQIFGDLDVLQQELDFQVAVADAVAALESQQEQAFIELMEHGTMVVELYVPKEKDLQQPHRRDELYFVISGSGTFLNGERRHPFQEGDVLFVPAGQVHRFENFTADFKTWVIFYGPDGGEQSFPVIERQLQIKGQSYTLSNDPKKLEIEVIHPFLTNAYWSKGRTKDTIQQAMAHSLNFGLYHKDKQIGYTRIITDYTYLVYLCDVFVLEHYEGKGLAQWMLENILNYEPLRKIKNWMLHTEDAHTLYARFGFGIVQKPEIIMERTVIVEAPTDK